MNAKLALSLALTGLWLNVAAQWQQIHPRPTGWSITGISAPGQQRVFAVAASTVLMSDNMGATWNVASLTEGSPYFNGISFADPLRGIACSDDGMVYVTADGGLSWDMKKLTPSADMLAVHLLPTGLGYAGGYYGKLFKTVDFGQNWSSISETFDQDNISKIFVLDEDHIYLFDDWDAFYWTTNGGDDWNLHEFSNINKAQSMHFFDAQNGILGDDFGTLLRTTNGGQSWEVLIDDGETDFYSMSFQSAQKGIIGCWNKLMITDNGGDTWKDIEMPDYGDFYSIDWRDESTIYAGCEGGVIIRSLDGGLTWEKVTQGALSTGALRTGAFYGENTILAFSQFLPEILRSVNRGYSWQKLPEPAEGFHRYRNACSVNGEVIFVITLAGVIFKTTDGGDTWQMIETGISVQGIDVYFLSAEVGFYTAADGAINRTVNGGESWEAVFTGTSNISKITFRDSQLGIAVGASGTILRTTNGGLEWTPISNTNTHTYWDVTFVGENTVFAVGQWGRIYRSLDAGLNWSQITTNINNELSSVVFVTPETGYATTSVFGTALKTVNGGDTWSYDPYPAPGGSKAKITPNGSIMVFGDYGHISILPTEGTWMAPGTPLATDASSPGSAGFTANWEASEDAAAYLLFVSEDNFQTYLPGYLPKYSEQTSASVTGLEPGKTYYYKVMAVNEAGYSEYSNTIEIELTGTFTTSIDEPELRLWPNPAGTAFSIHTAPGDGVPHEIEIFNVSGQKVFNAIATSALTRIETHTWAEGVYFLRLRTRTGLHTRKIVIKH